MNSGIKTESQPTTAFYCPRGYGECENARACVYPGRCGKRVETEIVAKPAKELTDVELVHELTECRVTLESIRPYRYRVVEQWQRELYAEYDARRPMHIQSGQPEYSTEQ